MTYRPAPPREDPPAMTLPPTITVPSPHVPTGPKNVPPHIADADYLDSAAWNLEHGYKVGGSGVTAMVVRLLRDAARAVRTADETPAVPPPPPSLADVVRAERRRSPHQCEAWQMQESAKGGVYCPACGDSYPDGFPGRRVDYVVSETGNPVSETGHRWPCTRYYVTATGRETCTCDAAARGVSS